MQEQFKAALCEQNARIRRLEEELGKAHAQTVSVRKIWSEIFDDVYREADAGKNQAARRDTSIMNVSARSQHRS